MKNTYVVFFKDTKGARIYVNPEESRMDEFEAAGNVVLLNPTRINLLGVPPHLWLPNVEKNEIYSSESTDYVNHSESRPVENKFEWLFILGAGAVGAALVEAVKYFVK